MEHELRDHVIVCGLQGVGFRIVEQLHLSGTPVIVIDADADFRFGRILEDWGVPHLQRSAYLGDALIEAGLGNRNEALTLLQEALREREPAVVFLSLDPRMSSLRTTPKYTGLVRRILLTDGEVTRGQGA